MFTLCNNNDANILFSTLNHIIFSNKISTNPEIRLVSNKEILELHKIEIDKESIYGSYYKNILYINIEIITSLQQFTSVLVHEMVHLYLEQEGCKETFHGNKFQGWKRKIKRRFNIVI